MSIPQYDYLDRPFVDEDMLYDIVESRYIPTSDFVLKNGYINLLTVWKTPEGVQSYLDLLSRVIQTYILSHYDNKYRYVILWYMAHSKQIRNALMQIYASSVWYNHRDGGFLIAYSSGLNFDQMKEIKFDIKRVVSPVEAQIIDNSFLGTRILEINYNDITRFETYDLLKAKLVTLGVLTQNEANDCESIRDLNSFKKVRIRYRIYQNEKEDYCLEDTKTYEHKILATKYEFDQINGSW